MPGTTSTEGAVLAAFDDDEILEDLRDLVAIPSVDGTEGELDVQRWCADRLTRLGLTVDCWDIDVAEEQMQPDFPGMEVERTTALGCVGVMGDTAGTPALAFCGHTDVVPPGSRDRSPEVDPFTLRVADGIGWGRGACDMKAGVAAALGAVAAVRRSGVTLAAPLAVHLVSGEEDGGLGAYATLRRGHRALACIIGEPTSGDLIPANAGSLTFRLEVPGLAAHGSSRSRGVSAIEKFELVHRRLRELEAARNATSSPLFEHLTLPWPLSIGIVSAGDWASTVPDLLVAEGRYGVRSDETVQEAVRAFEAAVTAESQGDPWLRVNPVRVSWPGGMFAPGALPAGHPLLSQLNQAVTDVVGRRPRAVGGPYGSDLRHYAAAGVPALQYGPGDVAFAHAVNEHVVLEDVFTCARVYAVMAVRRCGSAG